MDMGLFLFLILGGLLILNVPIAMALALSSAVCIMQYGLSPELIPIQIFSGFSKFLLLAVPCFIFAGNIMERVGISEKLITFCRVLVGHRRGGLAEVTVVTSCFFAAISGSGPATVAALGGFLFPAMDKDGYGKAIPAGLLASSGAIGTIIPPSIPFVVYGLVTGASISDLFLAGIVPGILVGTALVLASKYAIRKNPNIVVEPKASGAEQWAAFKDAFWGLLMPVIILGGIYGGIFTPTEAAAVACIYGLFVGTFIYRKLTLKILYETLRESAVASGNIMMIIACASLFAWFCSTSGITKATIELLRSVATNEYVFLVVINIVLLIAGCFVESSSAIYILVPIIYPVAKMLGYDVVALGVVFIINLAIGNVTPPVGLNLFVASSMAGVSIKEVSKHLAPFLIAMAICLLLVTYCPSISLFLPQLLK